MLNTLELTLLIGLVALIGGYQAAHGWPRWAIQRIAWGVRLLFYAAAFVASIWMAGWMIADPAHIQPITALMPDWQAWIIVGFAVCFLLLCGWWTTRWALAMRAARRA